MPDTTSASKTLDVPASGGRRGATVALVTMPPGSLRHPTSRPAGPNPPPPPGAYPPPPPPPGRIRPPPPYYPPAPGPYAPPTPGTNWWAIVSLVFGLLGGVLISVVCGIVGLKKAKEGQGGRGHGDRGVGAVGRVGGGDRRRPAVRLRSSAAAPSTATNVKAGDCLAETARPTAGAHREDRRVRARPHTGEIFAVMTDARRRLPRPIGDRRLPEKCAPSSPKYSPNAMTDDAVGLFVLYPKRETRGSRVTAP